MKLANKLTLYFFIVVFVPLSILSFVLLRNSQNSLESQVVKSLEIAADEKQSYVELFLNSQLDLAQVIANRTDLKQRFGTYLNSGAPNDQKALSEMLADSLSGTNEVINSISLLNGYGTVSASTDSSMLNSVGVNETFNTQTKTPTVYYFLKNNSVQISFIAPVLTNGNVIGFVKNDLSSNKLRTVANSRLIGKSGEAILAISHNGNIVYLVHRLFENDAIKNPNDPSISVPIKAALAGKDETFLKATDYRGVPILAVSRYIKKAGIGLETKIDQSEANAPLKNVQTTTIIVSLFSILLAFIVAYFTSKTITDPIKNLTEKVSEISKGNIDQTIPFERDGSEVSELAYTFNQMTKAVKESRADIDKKVSSQTLEIIAKAKDLEEQQKATINILEDVEKEKSKTETIAQDLEKFKLAVDNASDHIVITDPNGVILYANKGVTRITGFSQKEVIGQKVGSKQN